MNNKKRLEQRHKTNERFAKAIKAKRTEGGLTMEQVGDVIGTSRQAMSTFEMGKGVHFHTACMLAAALDIDLNEFKPKNVKEIAK